MSKSCCIFVISITSNPSFKSLFFLELLKLCAPREGRGSVDFLVGFRFCILGFLYCYFLTKFTFSDLKLHLFHCLMIFVNRDQPDSTQSSLLNASNQILHTVRIKQPLQHMFLAFKNTTFTMYFIIFRNFSPVLASIIQRNAILATHIQIGSCDPILKVCKNQNYHIARLVFFIKFKIMHDLGHFVPYGFRHVVW